MKKSIEELLATPVSSIMSVDLVKIKSNTYLDEVDKILDNSNIHHLPVVDDNDLLIGMLSDTDMLTLKHWGSRFALKESDKRNAFLLSKLLVSDVMTESLVTVKADDSLEHCAELLKTNRFKSLPVVEEGKIIGIITTFDLLITAYKNP